MFIQCQHCQTTYKIDEHKIPEKESAVRCTTCSELIPLNREEQDELLKKTPKQIVECDSCGTEYSVPLSTIKQESTKARCGKCGNLFTISRSGENDLVEDSPSAKAYEDDFSTDDIDLDNIDIPPESEIEVDELFGDVSATESQGASKKSSKGKDANEEYLESIKLTNGDENEELSEDDSLGINEIAKDHKYKIFLKPNDEKKKGKSDESGDAWPDIENDLGLSDIEDQPGKKKKKAKEFFKKKKPATQKKQKATKAPGKNRNIFLWVIWALVVLALVALAFVIMEVQTEQIYSPPQTEAFDSKSKIAILEPLNGRFIQNSQIGKPMFILEGKLLNVYGENVSLSKIEIEGYLYEKGSDKPITAISYAGSSLKDEQLKKSTKKDIESFLMSQSLDSNALKEFGSDDLIDFQVVFFDAPNSKKLTKLGAKINKFNRKTK